MVWSRFVSIRAWYVVPLLFSFLSLAEEESDSLGVAPPMQEAAAPTIEEPIPDTYTDAGRAAAPSITSNDSMAAITSEHPIDQMTVSSSRHQRLLTTAQSLSIIRPDEWEGTSKSIADVIADQTGVQTRRYGGAGSFQTVSIRGVQGSEVLVLLDGIPLNSAMGGAVDLGKINNARLEEIEIYRGKIPGRFGGNSLGGAINLKTRQLSERNTADISSFWGSYGRQNHSVTATHSLNGSLNILGALTSDRAHNNYPYLDRNNTLYGTLIDPTLDDTVRRVENDQFSFQEFRLHPSILLPSGYRLLSGFSVSQSRKNLPAVEGKTNKTAHYDRDYFDMTLLLRNELDEKTFFVEPRLSYRNSSHLTVTTHLDQGFGSSHGGGIRYAEYGFREQSIHAHVTATTLPVEWIRIEPTLMLDFHDGMPTSLRNATYGDWHSREGSGSISLDAEIALGPFTLAPGGSIKGIYGETEGGLDGVSGRTVPASDTATFAWAGNLTLSYRPSDRILLYVNGGRLSNPPSLRERYGAQGGQMPNPDLVPETGVTVEAGVKATVGNHFAEAVLFGNRLDHTIILVRSGDLMKPVNCEGSEVWGVEFKAHFQPLQMLSLDARSTIQRARNLTREYNWYGRRLPGQPDVATRGTVTYTPTRRVSIAYSANFKSFYFHLPASLDDSRVPARTGKAAPEYGSCTHDIRATLLVGKGLKVICSADNLTRTILPAYPPVNNEAGYSLILYPANQFSISGSYCF